MEIINNTLITNHNMPKLVLEDEYYKITIWYVGDYVQDIKTKLDVTYLAHSIFLKKDIFDLFISFKEKKVYINENCFFILEDEIDKVIEKFQLVKQEIKKLKPYLEKYFFSYY